MRRDVIKWPSGDVESSARIAVARLTGAFRCERAWWSAFATASTWAAHLPLPRAVVLRCTIPGCVHVVQRWATLPLIASHRVCVCVRGHAAQLLHEAARVRFAQCRQCECAGRMRSVNNAAAKFVDEFVDLWWASVAVSAVGARSERKRERSSIAAPTGAWGAVRMGANVMPSNATAGTRCRTTRSRCLVLRVIARLVLHDV